jgi:hypothetical protein
VGIALIAGFSYARTKEPVAESTEASPAAGTLPAWLAGSWAQTQGDRYTQELWTAPRGDTMMGVNRTVQGDRTVAFEYLRMVKTGEGVFYLAGPGGKNPPTSFKQTAASDHRIVFENPEHDFPTRIEYERQGDTLRASIHGVQDGKERSMAWEWTLADGY